MLHYWPVGWLRSRGSAVETPETNLVFFDTTGTGLTAAAFAARLRALGLAVSVFGTFRGRACTHLDVSAAQIDEAVALMRDVLATA